jgi:hypothetical protein
MERKVWSLRQLARNSMFPRRKSWRLLAYWLNIEGHNKAKAGGI